MINSQGYEGMYVLINPQNGTRVTLGEEFLLNGQTFKIEGGRAPHKAGSTGRIWVREVGDNRGQQEVFPHVHDLQWVLLNGIADPQGPHCLKTYPQGAYPFINSDFSNLERRVLAMSEQEILDHFYTIEVLISADRAIGGKAYWERVQNSNMSLYQRTECDDELIKDYHTARKAYGHLNVRIVEVTKNLVTHSV